MEGALFHTRLKPTTSTPKEKKTKDNEKTAVIPWGNAGVGNNADITAILWGELLSVVE